MPWKYGSKIIREGRGWTDNAGTKHPYNWNIWSDADKKAAGLTWEDPPASEAPFDNRFYLGRKTDGSLIEKNLTDVNSVDEDGKAVIDPITGKQAIQLGLKSSWITQTKQTANSLLSKSDWMVTRKSEKGTAIPDATQTYRDSVRTACNTIETKINACSNLTEFMALFDAPSDGGNPPMFDFPQES